MDTLSLSGICFSSVEIIKKFNFIPNSFLPVASIAIGIILSPAFDETGDVWSMIANGFIAGLSASGAYAGAKTVAKTNKAKNAKDVELEGYDAVTIEKPLL